MTITSERAGMDEAIATAFQHALERLPGLPHCVLVVLGHVDEVERVTLGSELRCRPVGMAGIAPVDQLVWLAAIERELAGMRVELETAMRAPSGGL